MEGCELDSHFDRKIKRRVVEAEAEIRSGFQWCLTRKPCVRERMKNKDKRQLFSVLSEALLQLFLDPSKNSTNSKI